jgi:hypothetical protein
MSNPDAVLDLQIVNEGDHFYAKLVVKTWEGAFQFQHPWPVTGKSEAEVMRQLLARLRSAASWTGSKRYRGVGRKPGSYRPAQYALAVPGPAATSTAVPA